MRIMCVGDQNVAQIKSIVLHCLQHAHIEKTGIDQDGVPSIVRAYEVAVAESRKCVMSEELHSEFILRALGFGRPPLPRLKSCRPHV